jgi:hypothetical protein
MNCVPSPCLSWISVWTMQLFCQKQSDLLSVWERFICGGNIPWLLPGFTWGWEVVALFSRFHQIACAFWCCILIYLKAYFLVFLVLGTCEGWVGNKRAQYRVNLAHPGYYHLGHYPQCQLGVESVGVVISCRIERSKNCSLESLLNLYFQVSILIKYDWLWCKIACHIINGTDAIK